MLIHEENATRHEVREVQGTRVARGRTPSCQSKESTRAKAAGGGEGETEALAALATARLHCCAGRLGPYQCRRPYRLSLLGLPCRGESAANNAVHSVLCIGARWHCLTVTPLCLGALWQCSSGLWEGCARKMGRLWFARKLLTHRKRQFTFGYCPRLIYSQTGVWPTTTIKFLSLARFFTLGMAAWHRDDGDSQGKKYVLSMFPYPSGKLHLGHVRVYATSDAMARFYRHRGYKSLLDGLSDTALENWRDITKIQRHWIGECGGYRVEMDVAKESHSSAGTNQRLLPASRLNLWMTQPELLHGISFLGVRRGHVLDTEAHRGRCCGGHQLLKVHAICPISRREIPIIMSDTLPYIEDTEAYVGIPCISEEDKNISSNFGFTVPHILKNGRLINSGELSDLSLAKAREQVTQTLVDKGAGGFPTSAKQKDWLISRQRYWGTPIPIVHCPSCGVVPVPEHQLPVELPKISHFPKRGISPLKEAHGWLRCSCPRCGQEGQRETDTMDTFVDSSWYFLRFLDVNNEEQPFSFKLQEAFMPVDLYVGGKEHAVLHMLYARFMQHFLASEGLVSHWEPFKRLIMMGMVMGSAYKVKDSGRYLTKDQVDFSVKPPVELGTGASLVITTEKMSKSKNNGIDPQEVLEIYGTDTTRLLMLANFAPGSPRDWSEETFPGIFSWQNRLWMTVAEFIDIRQNKDHSLSCISDEERKEHEQHLWNAHNHALYNVTYIMEHTHQLNAAIAFMQALTTSLRIKGEKPQQVKVPRRMLDHLSPEQALQLVSKEKNFQEFLQGRTIVDTQLKILPGLRASVFFTYSVHDVARAKQELKKRKEEKKKQKLENKMKRKQRAVD
ncbi:putative leucine--tRNA ligase, mitochondrial [Portunus trituberculatus]|uniref:leucine--tRNA ligase n=1 Tax=Portunus trituberculatus TaxID=210409 RepID=A0A5B7CQU8_PORTR|nr:putative leucine--tRNA ligase, mitochondrial [Portunus trituberculatus]